MAFYAASRFASRFARRAVRTMVRRRPARAFVRRPRRLIRKTQNRVHSYIRWSDKDTEFPGATGPPVINETLADQHLAYTFKLDNVVNPSDFTNLYDLYKINKVVLHLEPAYTDSVTVNWTNKKLRVVHDYNDNNPLTQEDDYLEYSNCKSYGALTKRTIKITLYPKLNNIIENVGGGASAYTSLSSSKQFLAIDNDEVPHFGIKIFVPKGILGSAEGYPLFTVRARFHLSLKNSK